MRKLALIHSSAMRICLSSLAAIAVQPLVMAVIYAPDFLITHHGIGGFVTIVLLIAAALMLILGIPLFLLLRRYKRDDWQSMAITGFFAGAIPLAFFWPRQDGNGTSGSTWHGRFVYDYIQGKPTEYAWLGYWEQTLYFGLHGLTGSLVFYAVWSRLHRLSGCSH